MATASEFADLGASLALISPDLPSEKLLSEVARAGARVHVLRDPTLGVALRYGLVFRVPEVLRRFYLARDEDLSLHLTRASWLLPIPANYVVVADRTIALAHVDADFTRRLHPGAILDALRRT